MLRRISLSRSFERKETRVANTILRTCRKRAKKEASARSVTSHWLPSDFPFSLLVKLIMESESLRPFFDDSHFVTVAALGACVLGLQRPPPRYSQQYMPETSFTCRNKIVGSYYADPETDCQVFHVCVSVSGTIQDYK